MVARAVDEFGRLDILVNNAVSSHLWGGDSPIADITEANFDAGMGILVKAHFLAAKQAVPHMEAAGGGSIVNISSVHGMLAAPGALILRDRQARRHWYNPPDGDRARPRRNQGERHLSRAHSHRAGAGRLEGQSEGLEFFVDQYPVGRTGSPWI